jgi:hypothetical protein
MKGRPVDQMVFDYMFPKPRATDPQNFHSLLHRHLILEVRQEVHSFYGHLDTQEAKYPGLDYCNRIHRIRLSRWQWHRRLFRAFDGLRLTAAEIAGLTKWEGTKWAKDRFERDSGVIIRDTAADGFPDWATAGVGSTESISPRTESDQLEEETADEDMDGEEDSDGELESIGVPLNEQLRERAARHEAGDTSEPLDEEWEQWLKNAIDSGELPFLTNQILRQSNDLTLIPQALFPPRMLSAARAGQWHEIPDFLHDMLRRTLESETTTSRLEASTNASSTSRSTASAGRATDRAGLAGSSSWRRRTYSDLRLPINETSSGSTSDVRLQPTAQPNA